MRLRREDGFALLFVLWVLLAVGALAATLLRAEDPLLLRPATAAARLDLDVRARSLVAVLLAELDAGKLLAGSRRRLRLGDVEVEVRISGESGRVDLNAAPPAVIDALLAAHGVPEEERARLRDALLDWRDPDDLVRLAGAERAAYRAAGREGPGNRPLRHPAELARVLGFAPDLVRALWDDVTVHTGRAQVEGDLASPALARALGIAASEGAPAPRPDPAGIYRLDIRLRRGEDAAARLELVVRRDPGGWRVLEWSAPRALGEEEG